MKKAVLASVLAVTAGVGAIYSMPVLAQDQGSQSSQITIKDPAEYNAYQNAIGQGTPAAKASAIEDFLTRYPQSVVKGDLLQQLLGIYQQSGDLNKTLDAAGRLLQVDPNNLRALALYVYIKKAQFTQQASNPTAAQPLIDDAAAKAQQGLNATRTGDIPQGDFDKLKAATAPIFHSAIAVDDVAKKDYKGAEAEFIAELKAYSDASGTTQGPGLNDTYLLGNSYIQQDPKDLPSGIFYIARAAQYASGAAKDQLEQTAEYWYKKYHGGIDGFDQVKQLAHDNLFPPAGYSISAAPPPPPPDKLAHDAVTSTPDLKTLALTDKEFVLANGNQEDSDKVWAVMNGVRTEVPGVVIQGTVDSVQLAVSPDAQQSKTAEFTINFSKPLAEAPAVGASVKYIATFDSYTKTPLMIILKDGELPETKKPAAAHHPAPHRAH